MKYFLRKNSWFVYILLGFFPIATHAQNSYKPISPLGTSGDVDLNNPDIFIGDLFLIFVSVSAIIGVIRLMICGIQYMTSEVPGAKADARSCIGYVIGGLLLILISFLILNTINRDFTESGFNNITQTLRSSIDFSSNPTSSFDYLPDNPFSISNDPVEYEIRGNTNGWCYRWAFSGNVFFDPEYVTQCGGASAWTYEQCVEERDSLSNGTGVLGQLNPEGCICLAGDSANICNREEINPFDSEEYENRITIDQGYCYAVTYEKWQVLDNKTVCAPGSGEGSASNWTLTECQNEVSSQGIDSACSQSGATFGTGQFCFMADDEAICNHDDSEDCTEERYDHAGNFPHISRTWCFRPLGSTP